MEDVSGPSMKDFARVFFKRKWQIFSFIAATILAATVASSLIFKSSYLASADILMQVGREHVFDLSLATSGAAIRPIVKYDERAQLAAATEMLAARSLVAAVVEKLGPDTIYEFDNSANDEGPNRFDSAVLKLQRDISIEQIGASSMIRISFPHEDSEIAARVVNQHADSFLDRQLSFRQNDQLSRFFETQLEVLKEQMIVSEQRMQQFVVENELVGPVRDEIQFLLAEMVKLEAATKDSTIQRAASERRIRKLRSQLNGGSSGGNRVPGVMSSAQYEQVKLDLLTHEREADAFAGTAGAQRQQLNSYEKEITRLTGLAGEYKRLNDQVVVDQENHRLYLTKFEESKVSSAMDDEGMASAKIVERAFAPTLPQASKMPLILALACGLGSLLGVAFAFLAETLSGTISTRRELEAALGVPILATIPDGYTLQNQY